LELRLLSTERERQLFTARVEQIRARHGAGFKERPRSRLAGIHLTFGNLYALFENNGDPAERMIAGLVMHDLEMFPQTCPSPIYHTYRQDPSSKLANFGHVLSAQVRSHEPPPRFWPVFWMPAPYLPIWASNHSTAQHSTAPRAS